MTPSRENPVSANDVSRLLETGVVSWWRRPKLLVVGGVLVLAGLGLLIWSGDRNASQVPRYETAAVERGNITLTVTADGTLEPTRSVAIGSELSGTVSRVLVDVNDRVTRGQVLVELDTSKLSDQILRSRATLAAANAQVAQAAATGKEARSNLARLEEVSKLSGGKVPSAAELDTARATLDRALADEASARANVADAQAALSTDATNLKKAAIRSSIDGVVLTRSVEPGNAVAASLQAVTLLTLAEDLQRLQLQVNVDEADVGSVAVGQRATFTVSAYPNRQFPATITRIEFGSTVTDNVVTYLTSLDVANDDLSLRSGMTATATIVAEERTNVLRVPNAALRYTPAVPQQQTRPMAPPGANGGGIVSTLIPRPPMGQARQRSAGTEPGAIPDGQQLWVLRDGRPEPITVSTGISDGRMIEVTGGGLEEGVEVIVSQAAGAAP